MTPSSLVFIPMASHGPPRTRPGRSSNDTKRPFEPTDAFGWTSLSFIDFGIPLLALILSRSSFLGNAPGGLNLSVSQRLLPGSTASSTSSRSIPPWVTSFQAARWKVKLAILGHWLLR